MKTLKEWGYLNTVTISAPQAAEATSEGAAAAKLADSISDILNGAWDIAGDLEEPVETGAGKGEGAA
ncbi:hypothetical protein JYK14_24475 [Siccirubricoccus sp. KC 17139]|uniref:Uncharacterized protein n=1 Tax=Siccirubricoccus soli TaxID=2899147 RepID=A0ABT1DBH2_9PROT|nr:hypothetical protein [Siccirubricoccus soli]MCO6419291.1 hypothetical protein [Siccirubricoccus soli]MCP2685426.1 hypothetical protein [Siccirubricoccus soli]